MPPSPATQIRAVGAPLTCRVRAEVCTEHENCHVHIGEGTTEYEVHVGEGGHAPEADCVEGCHLEVREWRWESHAPDTTHAACRMGGWATADGAAVHLEDRTGAGGPVTVQWAPMCVDCHDVFHGPHSHPGGLEQLLHCQGCAEHAAACPDRACRTLRQ
jgi:hypothetical protein